MSAGHHRPRQNGLPEAPMPPEAAVLLDAVRSSLGWEQEDFRVYLSSARCHGASAISMSTLTVAVSSLETDLSFLEWHEDRWRLLDYDASTKAWRTVGEWGP